MFILDGGILLQNPVCSQELFQGARAMFGSWRWRHGVWPQFTSCGYFLSISGSSMATAASMSRVCVARDGKRIGYAPTLATGVLAAGGLP